MLFAVVMASLIALSAAALAMLAERLWKRRDAQRALRERLVFEIAGQRGGVVTPHEIARELKLSDLEADRCLRRMVDEVRVTVEIDVQRGELRFVFPELAETGRNGAKPRFRASDEAKTPDT